MSGRFLVISLLSLLVALLVGYKWILPVMNVDESKSDDRVLWVGDKKIMVEIADENDEMSLGLGNRDSLNENSGMLFIYEEPLVATFWMKGMRFDLDFVWIRDGRVVEITKNVKAPESENEKLDLIRPSQKVDWILEVNSGWVERNVIKIGDSIRLE